jgi:hypothetical protein
MKSSETNVILCVPQMTLLRVDLSSPSCVALARQQELECSPALAVPRVVQLQQGFVLTLDTCTMHMRETILRHVHACTQQAAKRTNASFIRWHKWRSMLTMHNDEYY